ncbi:rhodanese-like domain-containing protein [Betaproteobacteria bacterium]|nr:rhodanese-like domain-containing protein [Betaproteobacteria bacterium]
MDFFFENILLISIAFISGGLLVWPLLTKNIGVKKLGTAETTAMLNRQNGILIDLREDDDLSGGIIPQAERIPSSILLKKKEEFDKYRKKFKDKKNQNKPIILVSNKANAVSVVGKLLKDNGFEEVFCLDGGIDSWIDAGLPVRSNEQ